MGSLYPDRYIYKSRGLCGVVELEKESFGWGGLGHKRGDDEVGTSRFDVTSSELAKDEILDIFHTASHPLFAINPYPLR